MTSDEVREILRMAKPPLSLEKPLAEEDDSKLGDFVEDELAESPFDAASLSLSRGDIGRALGAPPERERCVLDGGQPRTLEEVGRAFGVTRERMRQIENTTLKTLASLPEAQRLNECP
jgi:RNA polymerase primary sigma factor